MANIPVNTTLLNETIDYDDDFLYDYYDYYFNSNYSLNEIDSFNVFLDEDYENLLFVSHVETYIIVGITLPLLLMAIYALYSVIKNDHVVPIYIINLFISDLIQLCCIIITQSKPKEEIILDRIYMCGVLTSVGFMLCISLERYLVIAHPLWYRFRRTIRISVAVCVAVWIIPPVLNFTVLLWVTRFVTNTVLAIFLIIPFPLFIFFLVGTLRALSASVSVPSDEKRRIVVILVLVLLIYTLTFLPHIIFHAANTYISDFTLRVLSPMFLRLGPLADLLLYVVIKKETFGKLWISVCCCRKENNATNSINMTDLDHI